MSQRTIPTPPKWPFFLGGSVLLLSAGLLFQLHPEPFSPLPLSLAAVAVLASVILCIIPFLLNHEALMEAARLDGARQAEAMAAKLNAASEPVNRAASQIHKVEENITRSIHAAETLPYRMQEKIAEMQQEMNQADEEEKDALRQEILQLRKAEATRLEQAAAAVQSATAAANEAGQELRRDQAALLQKIGEFDTSAGRTLSQLQELINRLDERTGARLAEFNTQAEHAENRLAPRIEAALAAVTMLEETIGQAGDEGRHAPARRRTKTHDLPPAPAQAAATAGPDGAGAAPEAPPAEAPAAEAAPDEPAPAAAPEAGAVSDPGGPSQILATAYIGIGNKLFIRGEGGGLNWDKGQPLEFVSIGKWSWAAPAGSGPVTFKLLKNDSEWAADGNLTLQPGARLEVQAHF